MTKREVMATSLPAGTVIAGRYEIVRLIGAGGMGSVYEAIQLAIGRRVALKVLRPDVADDPLIEARFQREARAAASIEHPHVVVVHEFGRGDEGTLFLAMELLHGESLLSRLRQLAEARATMPAREAVRIAIDVASALEAAHAAGIVHRDLKPDNIMLLEGGGLKVLDFGIARILDDGPADPREDRAALTDAQQMLGTPRYMSPEAVARLPVGPSADLYALGTILFEMLAGRPVFRENEPVILMGLHLREPAPSLREVRPSLAIPAALDALVLATLAKLPTERPASATVVREALEALDWDTPAITPAITPAREPAVTTSSGPASSSSDVSAARFAVPEPSGSGRAHRITPKPAGGIAAMRALVVAVGAIGLVGALAVNRMRLDEERSHPSAAEEEPALHAAPLGPRLEEALITVETNIADPEVLWDDEPMEGTSFTVTLDRLVHRLEVRASGYTPRHAEIVADGPHTVALPLSRAPRQRAR